MVNRPLGHDKITIAYPAKFVILLSVVVHISVCTRYIESTIDNRTVKSNNSSPLRRLPMRQVLVYGMRLIVIIALCFLSTAALVAQSPIDAVIAPDTMFTIYLNAHSPIEGYIRLGNFSGDHLASDIDLPSLIINDQYTPLFTTLVPFDPDFTGKIVRIGIHLQDFIGTYPDWWDTTITTFTVSGLYKDGSELSTQGDFIAIGHISGDINGDLTVNIGDVIYLINTIFRDGPAVPRPYLRADANGDQTVNVGDAVYLVNYIFRGGPPPVTHQ